MPKTMQAKMLFDVDQLPVKS